LLIKGLAEAFWDGVFPLPDEDGIATRVAPVTGLSGAESDGTLMPALRQLPLFNLPDGTAFAWWQYERSVELETIADEARRQARLEAGTLPLADVEKLARAAGQAHFARLKATLAGTIEAWQAMGRSLDTLAAPDGPSTGRVLNLLRAMEEAVLKYAPAEDAAGEPAGEAEAGGEAPTEGGGGGGGGGRGGGGGGGGRSREELLRQLAEIAAHFRRTEPNSPLSYTLDDAVRRARLSWPDLLLEVVPDETTRNAILTSLGIKPPEPRAEE
jgi:type VI secretion system protein ImpA